MFFSVTTKNLNWKILTEGVGVGGGVGWGGLGQFADLRGALAEKRGWCFLRGLDTLMHTSSCSHICNSVLAL